MSDFAGFPVAALDFYDDLEMDNTRSFWTAHKQVYEEAVRAPMLALCAALEPEFGPAKVFRPYRDVRFARDKTPYKTNQGAYVSTGPASGWYVEVSAAGVRVGAGFWGASTERLTRLRDAIADQHSGSEIEQILTALSSRHWARGGEQLKTAPRGYPADHPRVELLRHKSLTVGKSYGFEPIVHTPALLRKIRTDWRAARPFVEWTSSHGD